MKENSTWLVNFEVESEVKVGGGEEGSLSDELGGSMGLGKEGNFLTSLAEASNIMEAKWAEEGGRRGLESQAMYD